MSDLRIGIIGAGQNTRRKHIPELQKIEGAQILAVCNRSEASGARVAQEFGIPDAMTDWRALTERPDLDAVVIGTWPYTHAEMAIAALQAGKHVLCEARMAMDRAEALEMLSALNESGLVGQVVPSPMGFRTHHVVKELVESGFLGQVREIHGRNLSAQTLDPQKPIHWRQRRDLSGLNIMSMGILYEMSARYFGHARFVTAQSALWTARRLDAETGGTRAVDVPESLQVLAEMESGALASFRFSTTAAHGGGPRLEAYGSRGALRIEIGAERAYVGEADGKMRELEVPSGREGIWRVERDFAASIREGKPVELTSFEEGVRYMSFTEAVHRSLETGCRESVPGSST